MKYLYFLSFLICVFFTNVDSNIHSYNVLKHFERIQVSRFQSSLPFKNEKLENNSSFFEKVLLMNNTVKSYVNDLTTDKNKCLKDLWYILKNLKSHSSIQILDASGKLPSGVLLGNLLWIGKYDECSNVYVPSVRNETLGFHGIYCMAQWNISMPNKINVPMHQIPIKTGVCVPSSCHSMDVKTDIIHIFSTLYSLPIIEHYDGDVKLTSLKCQSKNSPLNVSAVLFISVLGIYLSLPVIRSLITAIQYFYKYIEHLFSSKMLLSTVSSSSAFTPEEEFPIYPENEECEDDQVSLFDDKIQNITNSSNWNVISVLDKVIKPLNCFCIFSNAAQILNTDTTKKQFPCLHGLRFISMTWVILGHTYVHNINYIDNYLDLLKGIDSLPFQAVMQGTFSVDTFFLIGGFLLGYLYLEEADKRDGKINWLGLCLHRFLRITPVYVFLIGFSTLLFKYLGYGPFWEEADDVATCNQYWWWNVLYINNFLPINSMCLDWTWYLANDMQFFVLGSLILYVLWRWKYVGIGIFCSLLLGSWICTGYLSYIYDIPPLFMGITEVKNYTEYQGKLILAWDILYSKPYCRIGPHIIGILLAYLMHYNMHKKFTMSVGMQVIGWCLAAFCSASVIYGLYHVKPSSSLLHLYNALGRSSFSLGVGWLIFCCLTGQGGFINTFLSYKLWIPLSRLTFCAYLFHPLVMNWYFQVQQVPLFFSHSTMVALFISFLFISYGVAFVISIIFEAPLINLEKIIYKRWKYVGIGIFCSLLLGSWICTGYLSYIYDIPPLFMGITEVKNYTEYQGKLILAWDILYSKPYCRIGPHIIGILLAYLMHYNMHKKFTMSVGMQVIGWCLAAFCSASVIYGLYHVKPSSSLLHLYNALGRSSFSLGVGWLIFCCLTGQGGFINTFLSYKLWIPLSRLTFCAYLFHPLVMNWYFQVQQVPLFFSHSTMVALFISFLFISYGVAFVISIIFEAPLINLEKIIYKR